MIKQLLILVLVSFTVSGLTRTENLESYTYEKFLEEWNKTYDLGSEDYAIHEKQFYSNVKFISDHNKLNDGLTLAVNQFADLNSEEMKAFKGHQKKFTEQNAPRFLEQSDKSIESYPKSVDWRTKKGVLSATKNQKQCGSCWAFSATESIESVIAIKTGQDAPVLSPQQIVDCSPNPQHCGGTGGCEGSIEQLAFQYIIDVNGMASDEEYPYKGKDETCRFSGKTPVGHISSYKNITHNDRNSLMEAIQINPISISVDASSPYWQFYYGGIMKHCEQDADIDHGVQAVGYDMTDPEKSYWIIRNSWAHHWGMGGFIYLKMFPDQPSHKEFCGTDSTPKDGSGCDGGPPTVPVCGMCGLYSDSCYPIV